MSYVVFEKLDSKVEAEAEAEAEVEAEAHAEVEAHVLIKHVHRLHAETSTTR